MRTITVAATLLLLMLLSGSLPVNPEAEYQTARLHFLHGQLEQSQNEATRGYARYLTSKGDWSSRFQLLEAESMLYRGLYSDVMSLLANYPRIQTRTDESIHELTLEAIAFARLHQYEVSKQKLSQAEDLCSEGSFDSCGGVMMAHGLLALERGEFEDSNQQFKNSLSFARKHNDEWLQTASLLNMGASALQQEHFDEAVSYSEQGLKSARALGAENNIQTALGNLGWAYYGLGDNERALELLKEAEQQAVKLGNTRTVIKWLAAEGTVYQKTGDLSQATQAYRQALNLATRIGSKTDIINSLERLAHLSAELGKPLEANQYIREVTPLTRASGNRLHVLDIMLVQGRVAAAERKDKEAEDIFRTVEEDPASQTSMRLGAGHQLAKLYETQGKTLVADRTYKATLAAFVLAQDELKNEDSKLPFVANAAAIYGDYIHFLVQQSKPEEALAVADQSRARTLEQGLGLSTSKRTLSPLLQARTVAQKSDSTLLFYWLDEKQSYLWAITPKKVALYILPARREITDRVERYRKVLLGPSDPSSSGNEDGRALYRMLVAPARDLLRPNSQVVVLADGALSKLNFETLIVSDSEVEPQASHYLVEDLTLLSAPSMLVLANSQAARNEDKKLLLLGDAVSPGPEYPKLPMAATEMGEIEKHFAQGEQTVFSREQATAHAYFQSAPEHYGYIHFVAHAVASNTAPLDSAILLSRNTSSQDDSFKLYARQILQRPIHAELVTISACYGSGMRSYAGEGLVGLSWAFLRAGAHNVIGALWEVSDESTPQLMGGLYQGLEAGLSPPDALRQAKLKLLHSNSNFRKPYYWGPFQLYSGL
ncbi:CHAT domain-containing protein [Terriglobus albidus]|uniref:CHAT domain-containing protein n=1 Tax=Terriglobus albidus TaxID=1592106 RepID=UPI00164D4549|nr:CHAT domain-containing protein [Terriglobus albidus]